MGFFKKLFGTNEATATADAAVKKISVKVNSIVKAAARTAKNNIPTTSVLNLKKRADMVLNLVKDGPLAGKKARVALILDVSGSIQHLFNNGTIQELVERVLPLGVQFDDNAAIDLFLFSSSGYGIHDLGEVTPENFANYVPEVVLKQKNLWGGTDYAPIIEYVTQKYTTEPGDPAYIMFITDGNNNDRTDATAAITEASKHPLFFQFIGVGSATFRYLEKLDTMPGRTIDNANFFQVNDLKSINDEELYKRMLAEFPDWWKLAEQHKII